MAAKARAELTMSVHACMKPGPGHDRASSSRASSPATCAAGSTAPCQWCAPRVSSEHRRGMVQFVPVAEEVVDAHGGEGAIATESLTVCSHRPYTRTIHTVHARHGGQSDCLPEPVGPRSNNGRRGTASPMSEHCVAVREEPPWQGCRSDTGQQCRASLRLSEACAGLAVASSARQRSPCRPHQWRPPSHQSCAPHGGCLLALISPRLALTHGRPPRGCQ